MSTKGNATYKALDDARRQKDAQEDKQLLKLNKSKYDENKFVDEKIGDLESGKKLDSKDAASLKIRAALVEVSKLNEKFESKKDECEKVKKELNEANTENKTLKNELEKVKKEHEKANAKIKRLEKKILEPLVEKWTKKIGNKTILKEKGKLCRTQTFSFPHTTG